MKDFGGVSEFRRLKVMHTKTADGRELVFLSGATIVDLKGEGQNFTRGHVQMLTNVATILPNGQRLKVDQSTVHVSPNSMTNGGVARNLAFAVDNMTLNDFATLQDRIRIDFEYAVRDVDGHLHRVGYSATVIGTFVQWVPARG